MKPLRIKLLLGLIVAGSTLAGSAFSDSLDTVTNGNSGTPVLTVRQEIADFANRYGKPVILHGALDLNAPVAMAFSKDLTSDQAIAAISQAAGAYAIRVYFVTPATGSNVTMGAAAERLIGDRGNVSLRLHRVTSQAAIEAVASADGAQAKFPDGIPSGMLSLSAASLPLSTAVARVATLTHTHWSLGYMLKSTNPSLPALTPENTAQTASAPPSTNASNSESSVPSDWPTGPVVANLPPLKPLPRDAQGNILPFTIHVPIENPAPSAAVSAQTAPTPQQIAAYRQQQYNYSTQYPSPSVYNPFAEPDTFDGSGSPEEDFPGNSYITPPTFAPGTGGSVYVYTPRYDNNY